MGQRRPALPEDVQQLTGLIRTGKVFALQDWIRAGKRYRSQDIGDDRVSILYLATEMGVHSVLEVLLEAGGWKGEELGDALDWALNSRRADLAELLFSHGAKLSELDFETVCRTMDFGLMERFLREGGDPSRDNAFARALRAMKARPLLRFFKTFRSEFPTLDDQAALALCDAVANDQVRWTALLAWAGADPFRPVPWDFDTPFPVGAEDGTTAATRATWRCNAEILKVLKLRPNADQAIELMSDAMSSGNIEFFRAVLAQVPADRINASARDSSEPLEQAVRRWGHRDLWSNSPTTKSDDETLRCIQLLLDRGARWNPDPGQMRQIRRPLLEHEPRYIVQLLRLLLYTPGAAERASVLLLCDSSGLRKKIAEADPPLLREIKILRQDLRKATA
jgi:hypothetical protein